MNHLRGRPEAFKRYWPATLSIACAGYRPTLFFFFYVDLHVADSICIPLLYFYFLYPCFYCRHKTDLVSLLS